MPRRSVINELPPVSVSVEAISRFGSSGGPHRLFRSYRPPWAISEWDTCHRGAMRLARTAAGPLMASTRADMRRASIRARATIAALALGGVAVVVAIAARAPLSQSTPVDARSVQAPTAAVFMLIAGIGIVMLAALAILVWSGRRRKDDPPEHESPPIEVPWIWKVVGDPRAVGAGGCAGRGRCHRLQTGSKRAAVWRHVRARGVRTILRPTERRDRVRGAFLASLDSARDRGRGSFRGGRRAVVETTSALGGASGCACDPRRGGRRDSARSTPKRIRARP